MYNFKKRVGLAIGTADPNDEDIQNTATGLGGKRPKFNILPLCES